MQIMKKILLTLTALISFNFGNSQSLKLNTQDTLIVVGASTDFELIADIDVENNSVDQLAVDVKRTVLSSPPQFSNYFCWTACYLPDVDTSLAPLNIGAYDINSAFSGHIRPNGTLGVAEILYTFFDSNNPNDSVSVLVIYNVTPVGIEDLNSTTVTNFFPNPSSSSINISYNSNDFNTGASISIFDLAGKEIHSSLLNLNLNNVIIDISAFQNGIYFYSVSNSKINSERKKFIVKH